MACISRGILVVLIGLMFARVGFAGPFDGKKVPGDVAWVLHIDMDAARDTKLWDLVDHELSQSADAQDKIQQLELITGMQFPRDLHDITLYGRSFAEDDGVVMARATVDKEKILSLLQGNESFKSEQHGKEDVLSWDDKGRRLYGSFFGDDQMIISRKQENVEAELDVLEGKLEAMKVDSALLAGKDKGLLAYVAGTGLSELAKQKKPESPIVKQVQEAWISIGEDDRGEVIKAKLIAKSADAAQSMLQSVNGIKAMVGLAAGSDDADTKTKAGAAALKTLTVKADGKAVEAEWPISLDTVRLLVDIHQGREATSKPAAP